jgi:Zn-dependent M16 (insulinase) family peptidase
LFFLFTTQFLDQSSPDGLPRGVSIFHEVVNNLNHDNDPTTTLQYASVFKLLKQEILNDGPVFLIDLISKNIIDNEHTIELELFPSTSLAQYNIDQEQVFIDTLGQSITFEERLGIIKESVDLRAIQEARDSPEALASIPRVKLSNLPKVGVEIPLNIVHDIFDSGVTLLENELEVTDGTLHAAFALDISNIDFDDVALLPLLCALLQEAGTLAKSDVSLQREVDSYTGGITVTPFIEEVLTPSSDNGYVVPVETRMVTKIMVRGSAVAANAMPLFNLMQDFIYDTDLESSDTKRKAIQIIKKAIDDMEDEILIRGHHFTTVRIESRYSLPAFVREQWEGMSQLMKLRELKDLALSDWALLSRKLLAMADHVRNSNRNGMFMSIAGDAESLAAVSGSLQVWVRDILPPAMGIPFPDFAKVEHPWAAKGLESIKTTYDADNPNEAFMAPTRVNHVGMGGILFDDGERIYGSDQVVVQFIGGHYLFNQLRFTLGAQQAWAELDLDSGVLVYQSDRDPNLLETLDIFENGASFVYNRMTQDDKLPIEAVAAIIGVIGTLDGTTWQPREASYHSLRQMLQQETPEMRQKWREEVLATNQDNFIAMVERLGAWGKTSICAVTSEPLYAVAHSKGLNLTTCDYTGYQCDAEAA